MSDSDNNDGAPVTIEELIALREGDLSAEQAAALQARIDGDPRAQELLVELAETDQVLDVVRNRPMPPDLADSIDSLIAREQARREGGSGQAGEEPGDGNPHGDGLSSGGAGSTESP